MSDKNNFKYVWQGYAELIASKKTLLAKYDNAQIHSKTHKIHTSHGNVAEAEFRKWLSEFLPIKYGITSGYIASQSINKRGISSLPHYDIIIYDAFECPILSIEDNSDESSQGKKRVIPAEYVRAVFEVKSNLTLKTIKEANIKIKELDDLLFDFEKDTNSTFNGKLHPDFFSANIFFDLKSTEFKKQGIFDNLSPFQANLKRHFTNLILRAEGLNDEFTGLIVNLMGDFIEFDFTSLISNPQTCTTYLDNGKYGGIMLLWTKSNFSVFAFSVLNLLNGTYRPGIVPSFYGINLS